MCECEVLCRVFVVFFVVIVVVSLTLVYALCVTIYDIFVRSRARKW